MEKTCLLGTYNFRGSSELKKQLSENNILYNNYAGFVYKKGSFTQDFKTWCTNHNIDIEKSSEKDIADQIIKYYKHVNTSVYDDVQEAKTESIYTAYGYEGIEDREEGKRHSATFMLAEFVRLQNEGTRIKSGIEKYYIGHLRSKYANELGKTIKDNLENIDAKALKLLGTAEEDIRDRIHQTIVAAKQKEGVVGQLKFYRALSTYMPPKFKSCLAVLTELCNPKGQRRYIDEILTNTKLQDIRKEIDKERDKVSNRTPVEEINSKDAEPNDDGLPDGEEGLGTDDVEPDVTIAAYDHSGLHHNFMTHLGSHLRNYFNSLPKLNTTATKKDENGKTIYDVNTNNRYGIYETMDANFCTTTLYQISYKFNDPFSMIEAIRECSNSVPGCEAFAIFAEDLENNYDLAFEVFNVFTKTIIEKFQYVIQNEKGEIRFANPDTDRRYVLRMMMRNKMRNAIYNGNLNSKEEIIETPLKAKELYVAAKKELKAKEYNRMKNAIVNAVRTYFPNIQKEEVLAFIELYNNANNNPINVLNNIEFLASKMNMLHKAALKITTGDVNDINNKDDIKDIINDSVSTPINVISDLLLPYCSVQTSLNSPNALGNLASDVINNSYVTYLKQLADRTEYDEDGNPINPALLRWAKDRVEKQASNKHSTILVEQVDENGNIISDGILHYDTIKEEYVLGRNAVHLVSSGLFDGASYMDIGTNMLYKQMVEGDFLPTAYMSFFDKSSKYEENPYKSVAGNGDTFARYFLRIPSDSPTEFNIEQQRYNINGFLVSDETEDFNKDQSKLLKRITDNILFSGGLDKNSKATKEMLDMNELLKEHGFKTASSRNTPLTRVNQDNNIRNLMIDIFKYREIPLKSDVEKYMEVNKETGKVSLYIRIGGDGYGPNNQRFKILLTGDLVRHGGLKVMENPQIVGLAGYTAYITEDGAKEVTSSKEQTLQAFEDYIYPEIDEIIKNERRNNLEITVYGEKIKTPIAINRNHKIFELYRRQFKKEMVDTAVALDLYFNTRESNGVQLNGRVEKKNKKIVRKRDNNKGYINYHLNKKGEVLSKDGKLDGAVFHSNKFTLVKYDKNGKAYKENYLDKLITTDKNNKEPGMINLLYGEAIEGTNPEGSWLHTKRNDDGEVVDVEFTEAQQEAIDKKIEEYIIDYLLYMNGKIKRFDDFIKRDDRFGEQTSTRNVADFSLNYQLALMNYDDLFEGNTKYYKGPQDILKRAKERQGGGTPYALVLNDDGRNDYIETHIKTILDTEKVVSPIYFEKHKNKKDKKNIPASDCVMGRNVFYGVTIHNTQLTNRVAIEQLTKQLADILVRTESNGDPKTRAYWEEHARTILEGPKDDEGVRRGGFQEPKVNDGQSWITVDEWIRRIVGRGQYNRHKKLIAKLVDPDAELTKEDLDEFVQVQKNFYYDTYYDERYKQFVPRQIKNAEFVLVPKLIKGTELEKVYNLMRKHGIDQLNTLETSKAANEEIITLWDNNGKFDATEFEAKAGVLKQPYSYRYLYTQQETPQHMNSKNKAGIQVVKKIVDNIPAGHPMERQKYRFLTTMVAKVKESFENLMDEFDIPRNADGSFNLNNISNINRKVFYDKFKDEMLRLGVDKNLIDYVTLDDSGEPLMPAISTTVLSRFENICQSMFNTSITRQKLPGFHAAQVTNVGWETFEEQLKQQGELLSSKVKGRTYDKTLEYHPMQYKNVNDENDIISHREYVNLSEEDKKKYKEHEPAKYMEIMIPLSALGIDRKSKHYRNMDDDDILKELKEKGLDTIIGYRIPTEGKQSIGLMKIVGFTPDAYGSTIVVPNDWVAQTGSDFDIDSIYGINFATYKDKKGEIHKVKFIEKGTKVSPKDWLRYLKEKDRRRLNKHAKGKVREARDRISSAIQSKNIDDSIKPLIEKLDKKIAEQINEDNGYEYGELKSLRLEAKINNLNNYLKQDDKKLGLYKLGLIKYRDYLVKIKDIANNENLDIDESDESIDTAILSVNDEIKEILKGTGIKNLDEYVEAVQNDPLSINSTDAKDNEIVQCMLDILNDDISLEENLSRSNFDDVTYWKNELMNDNIAIERAARSPYNIADQAAMEEDVMSGYSMKGQSVQGDTACSVIGLAKGTLNTPITVVYDRETYSQDDLQKSFGKRDDKGKEVGIRNHTHGIQVVHSTYGHSNNNRNSVGKLITSYSSQTTAYTLDAVKEGAVPNVNTYTFNAYKTLLNVGSDFKIAIGFIMQPGISQIVANNNANNSVYSRRYGNPVNQAIKDIALKLLGYDIPSSTKINDVFAMLNENENLVKAFNVMYGGEATSDKKSLKYKMNRNLTSNGKIPLIASKLVDRIKERGEFASDAIPPVEGITQEQWKLLFDLGTVLNFNYLNYIGGQVGKLASVLNPDKFGAKQTLFATNKIFRDCKDLIENVTEADYDEEDVLSGDTTSSFTKVTKHKPIITAKRRIGSNEEVHILEAIYPGISEGTDDDPALGILERDRSEESAYPTLYAFLKYATGTSTMIARTLLPTQKPAFVATVMGFRKYMNGFKPSMREELYADLEKYVLQYLYNKVPTISHPVNIAADGSIYYDAETSELEEKHRVYGFGYPAKVATVNVTIEASKENPDIDVKVTKFNDFTCKDVSDPTKEEIEEYIKLSPAQKVYFIQHNFKNAGIFGLLDVNLVNVNRKRYQGMQTIEFKSENAIDKDILLDDFEKVFNSKNPLVKLAAIDLVKYSLLVEGGRMKSKSISKIIRNTALYTSTEEGGLGLTNEVMRTIMLDDTILTDPKVREDIYENYLRSHNIKEVKTIYYDVRKNRDIALYRASSGGFSRNTFYSKPEEVVIEEGDTEEKIAEKKKKAIEEWYYRLNNAGIVNVNQFKENEVILNKYVYIKDGYDTTLYKIKRLENDYLFLYPLSKLEVNEIGYVSANKRNRKNIPISAYYEDIIAKYEENKKTNNEFDGDINKILSYADEMTRSDEFRTAYIEKYLPAEGKDIDIPQAAIPFDIMDTDFEEGSEMSDARNKIKTWINDFITGKQSYQHLFMLNSALPNYIISPGVEGSSIQKIETSDGAEFTVRIRKVKNKTITDFLKGYRDKDGNTHYRIGNDNIDNALNLKKVTNVYERQIIKDMRSYGAVVTKGSSYNNVFEVNLMRNEEDSVYAASIEEANYDAYDFMSIQSKKGDNKASRAINKLKSRGITKSGAKRESNNVPLIREVAKYGSEELSELRNLCTAFEQDPETGSYLEITNPKVQELLKGNNKLVEKYGNVFNRIIALREHLEPYYELGVTSTDPELKPYLDDISSTYVELMKLPVNEIKRMLAEGYVSALSGNTLIKDDVIKAYDGFFGMSGVAWMFNDIFEFGNPLVQNILKDVMRDIEGKRLMQMDAKQKYHKELDRIRKWARDNGMTIDERKLFTEDGSLAQDFSQQLVTDVKEKYQAVKDAAEKDGVGSIPHLKAKWEYDKFIADHFNQEAVPRYYQAKLDLEKQMIEKHPEIYERYMKLDFRRRELYSYKTKSGLNEELKKELQDVESKINYLWYPSGYRDDAGVWHNRKKYMSTSGLHGEEKVRSNIEAAALKKFIDLNKSINNQVFEYDNAYGFEEQLEKNLKTIADFEDRNPVTGLPKAPISELMKNDIYREAKNWVISNAKFVLNETEESKNDPNSIANKIRKVFERFALTSSGRRAELSKYCREHTLYDERGIPDPTSLTDEEIATIKRKQESYFKAPTTKGVFAKGSDKHIMSNTKPNKDLYTQEFWNKLRPKNVEVNGEYLEAVTELNILLEPWTDPVDGRILFENIPIDESGIETIQKIINAYQKVRNLTKYDKTTLSKEEAEEVAKFREENLDSNNVDYDSFNRDLDAVRGKKSLNKDKSLIDRWAKGMAYILYEVRADGTFVLTEGGKPVPNNMLYSTIKVKDRDKWLDKERMEDIETLNTYYTRVYTDYYYQARTEAQKKGETFYKDWYVKNHVYNPYTRTMEPLDIYIRTELRTDLLDTEYEGHWEARNDQRERKVKDGNIRIPRPDGTVETIVDEEQDKRNHNFKPNAALTANYIKGSDGGKYDANELNEAEKMMRDFIQKTLINAANTTAGKNYYEQGGIPRKAKSMKTLQGMIIDGALKQLGISCDLMDEDKQYNKVIDYGRIYDVPEPMIQLLGSKKLGSEKFNEEAPELKNYKTEEEYKKAYNEWKERRDAVNAKNKEVNKALLDKDYFKVIDLYLDEAARQRAIKDNIEKLYYLHNVLREQKVHDFNYDWKGNPTLSSYNSGGEKVYDVKKDDKMLKLYESFLRRLVFDQWKEKDSSKKTKAMARLQNFTSANYMMLNFRGGIANVTLGETAMWAEAIAGEQFNGKHLFEGHIEWNKGITGYFRGMYKEEAYGLQDGLCKLFKVVDYDEISGTPDQNIEKYAKRLRNAMFSPQTIGEHYMQNSVLFAMLKSHKIIPVANDPKGIGYMIMNKAEYRRYKEWEGLSSILTDEQKDKLEEFKNEIRNNKDEQAQYAWLRKDIITEFTYVNLDKTQCEEFDRRRKELNDKADKEFDEKDNLFNQFEFSNGKINFVKGSDLDKLNRLVDENNPLITDEDKAMLNWVENNGLTQAYCLLGGFTERVRKVNNKIHGVYNKLGRAYIENGWYGGIVMQYHKHLPVGILKRYRERGYFNETRGTYEKGITATVKDFLSLNARKVKHDLNLNDAQVNAIESIQNLFKTTIPFLLQLKATWNHLPEYDRANFRRQVGDLAGVVAGVAGTCALLVYGADDDEMKKNSNVFNLALYECDRLAAEAFLYNPIGLFTETRTLMSTPVAGMGPVQDIFNILRQIAGMIFYGDEYESEYTTGKYAGRNKLGVFIERRIPIHNGIRGVVDAAENNRVYKIGTKATSVASQIAKWYINDNEE